jgi:murein DD-endopeptidase MepM/ murein hydrolase activator NlpD
LFRNRKYTLDPSDLQYKLVRLPWKVKLLRISIWIAISVIIAVFYGTVFKEFFGSPKEKLLAQQIENMKLQYELSGRELDNSMAMLNSLRLSDDRRYRPILGMDTVPDTYRKAGFGGVDRFKDLTGYDNSDLLIAFRTRIEEIRNMASIQGESFRTIEEIAAEWKREIDHFPGISPVSVNFRLGDGYKFRAIHPVTGTPRMHNGQDFEVPYGTEVYATGDGSVTESGYNSGGFGNCIVIDHGYGFQTVYGHLSNIRVPKGMNVKRGDLIGISGSTGQSTGPHLHYQVEKSGQHMNPVNFFNNDMNFEEYSEMIQAFESKSKLR